MRRLIIAVAVAVPLAIVGASGAAWGADLNLASTPIQLHNARSGDCLDQDYSYGRPHITATAQRCNGGANQTWIAVPAQDQPDLNLPPGERALRILWLNGASRYCLDQDFTGGVPHPTVTVQTCNGGASQAWVLRISSATAQAMIVNATSGDCLDQDYSYGRPHLTVTAQRCNGGTNQLWS